MLDAIMSLANTKAGANLGAGLGQALGGGGPMSSDLAMDGRGWLDGSGWAVATGSARATGGDRDQLTDPAGASMASGTVQQAGFGSAGLVLMVLLFAGFVLKGRL